MTIKHNPNYDFGFGARSDPDLENRPNHPYYKTINNIRLARMDECRSYFLGTIGGVPIVPPPPDPVPVTVDGSAIPLNPVDGTVATLTITYDDAIVEQYEYTVAGDFSTRNMVLSNLSTRALGSDRITGSDVVDATIVLTPAPGFIITTATIEVTIPVPPAVPLDIDGSTLPDPVPAGTDWMMDWTADGVTQSVTAQLTADSSRSITLVALGTLAKDTYAEIDAFASTDTTVTLTPVPGVTLGGGRIVLTGIPQSGPTPPMGPYMAHGITFWLQRNANGLISLGFNIDGDPEPDIWVTLDPNNRPAGISADAWQAMIDKANEVFS